MLVSFMLLAVKMRQTDAGAAELIKPFADKVKETMEETNWRDCWRIPKRSP